MRELGPLSLVQVRRTAEKAGFNSLLQAHHYLGYSQPAGEHLKFMVYAGTRPVALFAWSSAPRHLGPRDRFIGWSPAIRRQNIGAIAYNTRYLILPWVRVEHLTSHLLGRITVARSTRRALISTRSIERCALVVPDPANLRRNMGRTIARYRG